jgi:hypothetical protein
MAFIEERHVFFTKLEMRFGVMKHKEKAVL